MTEAETKWPVVREELEAALDRISDLNLKVEVCGAWIWLEDDTKCHRNQLLAAGFKWASKKCKWFYRPHCLPDNSQNKHLNMGEIRRAYGSKPWL